VLHAHRPAVSRQGTDRPDGRALIVRDLTGLAGRGCYPSPR
jgi:hypothetical protein